MNRWIAWAEGHRSSLTAIVAAYFVVNVAIHDEIQTIAIAIINALTIHGANLLVVAIAMSVVVFALPWLIRRIRGGPHTAAKAFYCVSTALFVLLAGLLLSAINSEAIHFVQYGLLAVMLFPLLRRAGETITTVALLGAIDEGYQYWVLHRNWGVYYDFNDVVLNLLGGATGVLLVILALGSSEKDSAASEYSPRHYVRSGAFAFLAIVGAVTLGLLVTGGMTVDPATDAWVVLRRSGPPAAFWNTPDWGRSYHILTPIESACTLLMLVAFYVPLDFVAEWIPRPVAQRSTVPATATIVADGNEPA